MMKGNFLLCMQLRETEQYRVLVRFVSDHTYVKKTLNIPTVLTSYSRSCISKNAGFC